MAFLARLAISICADVVISPMTRTMPVVAAVSHATRPMGSCASTASSTLSETRSQSLSGCPCVTDSEVKIFLLFMFRFLSGHKKSALPEGQNDKCSSPSSFDSFAGFGTLRPQVAGFHWAVPSTTLDKAVQLYLDYTKTAANVKHLLSISANFSRLSGGRPVNTSSSIEMFTFTG